MSDFNYGSDEVVAAGGVFKNPTEGDHSAVLRSIIHCGMFRESYLGEIKKPCPEVIAIFELKDEEDFEEDGVTPLTLHKSFPLKKGDKAFMTKFIKALDPKGMAKGFDDLIGTACQVTAKGGKDKGDDGLPKYINFGGMSGMLPKFAAMIDPLVEVGVGHCTFEELTEAAIMELNPILEVANIVMKGERYEGSKAEEVITAIRVENPEFAIQKKKDAKDSKDKPPVDGTMPNVPSNLDDKEEF